MLLARGRRGSRIEIHVRFWHFWDRTRFVVWPLCAISGHTGYQVGNPSAKRLRPRDNAFSSQIGLRQAHRDVAPYPLGAARGSLRHKFFRSQTGTGGGDIAQFGGKAHNPQCELSHVPQVPLCKSSGTASHYVRRTGQTAVGAHVPDQLTGSNRYYSVAAENGFDVPSCDDNGLGYLLPLFENNLPGRAVDQPGKADQPYRSSRLSIELNATL
jgi:hypothetical protein